MTKTIELPSQDYLKECFNYDPETGFLTWKVRPLNHFKNMDYQTKRNSAMCEKKAGSVTKFGYIIVSINGISFRAHRIIWKLTTGKDPVNCVDHVNGIKSDNRLCNLREATLAENNRNAKIHRDNATGFKGVCLYKAGTGTLKTDRYRSQIKINGKIKCLGYFDTPEQAYESYKKTSNLHYGEFANHG